MSVSSADNANCNIAAEIIREWQRGRITHAQLIYRMGGMFSQREMDLIFDRLRGAGKHTTPEQVNRLLMTVAHSTGTRWGCVDSHGTVEIV